jgi:hypothetical protein
VAERSGSVTLLFVGGLMLWACFWRPMMIWQASEQWAVASGRVQAEEAGVVSYAFDFDGGTFTGRGQRPAHHLTSVRGDLTVHFDLDNPTRNTIRREPPDGTELAALTSGWLALVGLWPIIRRAG